MIISGVYYPVEFLPQPLAFLSNLIPATHSITSIRAALGVSTANAWTEMIYALLLSVVYIAVSFVVYKMSVRKAREIGSLLWF
jgi:ABC-2 type transport system permease protein